MSLKEKWQFFISDFWVSLQLKIAGLVFYLTMGVVLIDAFTDNTQ